MVTKLKRLLKKSMPMLTLTNQINKKDYQQIKDLYSLFFQETVTPENQQFIPLFTSRVISNIKSYKISNPIQFWIIKDIETGEIIAFAKARIYPNAIGLFSHIFVKQEYRGLICSIDGEKTFIASKLARSVQSWFQTMNVQIIEKEIAKKNVKLLNFHQKTLGYKVVREYPDAFILQKKLGD